MKDQSSFVRHAAIFLLLPLLIFVLSNAPGQTAPYVYGTKAYGMGGAFTSIADDISALMYNPAGISQSTFQADLGIGSNRLHDASELQGLLNDPIKLKDKKIDLELTAMSGASFLGYGLGLAANGSVTGSSDGCVPNHTYCADGDYMSHIILGAAIDPPFISLPKSLRLGVAYHHLNGGNVDFSVENGAGAVAYTTHSIEEEARGGSLGLGLLYTGIPHINLGLAVDHLWSDVTWTGKEIITEYDANDNVISGPSETKISERGEKLDTVVRAGISFSPPIGGLTLAADVDSDGLLAYGAEKTLLGRLLVLRIGQFNKAGETTTTAGLGVNLGPVRIDVATGTTDFEHYGLSVAGSVRF